ncbi:MAG TPA: addiction module antitoxin [Blastocatellia bacterium]|nr:addiction module antitoxin [Blastocatellia bacterium]
MPKELTITLDEQVYEELHRVVGQEHISQFIESLVRPHVIGVDLESAYRQMADDEARESEALEWAEATIGDAGDETR